MLEQAIERLTDKDRLLIHSDQGWHYQMSQYQHALKEKNITQSMSRNVNANQKVDHFWGKRSSSS